MITKDELSSVDIEVDFSQQYHKKCIKTSVGNIYIDIQEIEVLCTKWFQ